MVAKKSVKQKQLAGTLRPKPVYSGLDYVPTEPIGEPPDDMTTAARDYWYATVEASPEGLLTELDRPVLEQLCIARAIADQCAADIEADGVTVILPNGIRSTHPSAKFLRTQQSIIANMSAMLGCTPTTRRRLKRPEGVFNGEPEQNDFIHFAPIEEVHRAFHAGELHTDDIKRLRKDKKLP